MIHYAGHKGVVLVDYGFKVSFVNVGTMCMLMAHSLQATCFTLSMFRCRDSHVSELRILTSFILQTTSSSYPKDQSCTRALLFFFAGI
jgi:hypothetical protein